MTTHEQRKLEIVADNIHRLLDARGWSGTTLAEATGVHQSSISRLLNAKGLCRINFRDLRFGVSRVRPEGRVGCRDAVVVRECGCACCHAGDDTRVVAEHRRINVLLSRMNEQQRRWFVGHESLRLGFGGDVRMSRVTGLNVDTLARGRAEVSQDLAGRPTDRVRLPGGGRPSVEKKIRR